MNRTLIYLPTFILRNKYTFIDAFSGGRLMTAHQARDLRPHLVQHSDTHEVASPVDVSQRMLRNLISIGASRSNSFLRDTCYGLLRSSLEMMIEWYGPGMDDAYLEYGFMLSRVYLQLNINHEVSERLLSSLITLLFCVLSPLTLLF